MRKDNVNGLLTTSIRKAGKRRSGRLQQFGPVKRPDCHFLAIRIDFVRCSFTLSYGIRDEKVVKDLNRRPPQSREGRDHGLKRERDFG